MPRAVITPVGTSLRENALCWRGLPLPLNERHDWRSVVENDRLLSSFRAFRDDLWQHTAGDIAARFDPVAWDAPQLRRLSAELASLKLIDDQLQLNEDDEILLIHGSGDSQRPARVLHSLLADLRWPGGTSPKPKLEEYPGLDANQPALFVQALQRFSEALTLLGDEWTCVYNLTGGYKGAAVMLGIAAYVRMANARPAQVYYLHENSDRLIELTPAPGGVAPGAPASLRLPVPRVP